MPAPTIDVVVATFNGWEMTESCLRHLEAQTIPHTVIVVDNGSADGTPERLHAAFTDVKLCALGENRGFAAACNAGVGAGVGEFIVLVNNDVDADAHFLERLIGPLLSDEHTGSVAPLLVRPGGERIDSVGLAADPTLAGFPRLQGRPVADASERRPELLGPSGGGGAYRRTAWEDAGGMDEGIFLYQEDLDLALRLRQSGWQAAIAPDAVGVHLGSATAQRRSMWQRERAGFARGYILRRYGVLCSAVGPRALLTEALVAGGDAAVSRDLAALRGRLRGFGAADGLPRRARPQHGPDPSIGLRESLRLRRVDYAAAAATRRAANRVP
ncbi:MAG TPA: glycosyltransferase family 2 protein [Solirubrobacteraceae bacterium]|nr:glycosyltransferase family 2 protein [Solirubrobacteraceae bacterium]